jgi:uncharacterized protein YndB with AHSA1/START domain
MQAAQADHEEGAYVALRRIYPVPPEKVWHAWTDPQALSHWFGPGATPSGARAEIDLRVGGRFRIAFEAHGETNDASGVYQEVIVNRRLVFSWAWKSTPDRVSRISIELKPVAGGTELSFVHDRFFDQKARDNHAKGWPLFLTNLQSLFDTDTQVTHP